MLAASEIAAIAEVVAPGLLIASLAPLRRPGRSLDVWTATHGHAVHAQQQRTEASAAAQMVERLLPAPPELDVIANVVVDPDEPPVRLLVNGASGVWLVAVRAWSGKLSYDEMPHGRLSLDPWPPRTATLWDATSDSSLLESLLACSDALAARLPKGTQIHPALLVPQRLQVTTDLPVDLLRPATVWRSLLGTGVGEALEIRVVTEEIYATPKTKVLQTREGRDLEIRRLREDN